MTLESLEGTQSIQIDKYEISKKILKFLNRIEMWLSVLASVIAIGFSIGAIYTLYTKMHHPQVVETQHKKIADYQLESVRFLIQNEPFDGFETKAHCSSGLFFIQLHLFVSALIKGP